MRTLEAELTAAQKASSRNPFIRLNITEEGVGGETITNYDVINRIVEVHQWEEGYSGGLTFKLLNTDGYFDSKDYSGFRVLVGWGYHCADSVNRYSEVAPMYAVYKRSISESGVELAEFECVDSFAKMEKTMIVVAGYKLPGTISVTSTYNRLQTMTNQSRSGSGILIDVGPDWILLAGVSGSFLSGDIVTGDGISITLSGNSISQAIVAGGAWNRDTTILNILKSCITTPGILSDIVVDSDDPGTITSAYKPFLPIAAGANARYVLRQVMQMFRCGFRIDSSKVGHIVYLDPTEGADYTYTMSDHIVWKSVYESGVIIPNHCIMVDTIPDGEGHTYTYIGEDDDDTSVGRLGTISTVESNPTINSPEIATTLAGAWISKRVAEINHGVVVVPMNCGQELYDMISATGKNGLEVVARVGRIDRWYKANTGEYYMELQLGGLTQKLGAINIPGSTEDDIKDLSIGGVNAVEPFANRATMLTDKALLPIRLDMKFTAVDYNTVSWSAGTMYLADGSTQAISANSGLTVTGTDYLYCDLDDANPEILKSTGTFSTAATGRHILIAILVQNPDTDKDCAIVPAQGAGATGLQFIVTASQVVATNLSAIAADLGLVTAGEIRLGNGGTPGVNFTGIRIYKGGATYNIVGQLNGVDQCKIDSDGKFYAGGGNVILDATGVTIIGNTTNLMFEDNNNQVASIGAYSNALIINADNEYGAIRFSCSHLHGKVDMGVNIDEIDCNSSCKITNLPTPTANYDAATKKYVDDHVGGGSGSGDMLKSVYDTNNDGRVDKAEAIDNGTYSATAMQIAGAVITKHIQGTDTTIGPMTDDIDMDGNTITNLATPVANSDAVSKAYVDNLVPLFNHIDVVTASRTDDTVYQNTTGKPMLVTILCDMYQTGSAREWCRLDIGATSSPDIYASYFRLDKDDITGSIDSRVTLTAIVPPGWYYQYVKGGDDVSVYKWYEQY